MTIGKRKKVPVSIRLPEEFRNQLQEMARTENRSLNGQIETMLQESIKAREAYTKFKKGEKNGRKRSDAAS